MVDPRPHRTLAVLTFNDIILIVPQERSCLISGLNQVTILTELDIMLNVKIERRKCRPKDLFDDHWGWRRMNCFREGVGEITSGL